MKSLLVLFLAFSSLTLASGAGTITPYCPEGDLGDYTQKFTINENAQLSFEGNIYIKGDILTSSYCPAGETTDFDEPPVSIDYDVDYKIGDNVVLGIKDAYEVRSYDRINSCSATKKQVCFSYQFMSPYSKVLECADNEVTLNSSLAKTADFMHAQVKVIFECGGDNPGGLEYLYQFPGDEGLAPYDTLTGLMVIDDFNYDPEKVAKELGTAGDCGDGQCISGETCYSCPADCKCPTGSTCDSANVEADAIGCVGPPVDPEVCYDTLDNDGDGDIDCDDSDCTDDEACYYKLTGTVRTGSGKPVKYAGVHLLDSFSNVIYKEAKTDASGDFEIDFSAEAKGWGLPGANLPVKLEVELTDSTGNIQVLWDFEKANKPYTARTIEFGLPTKKHFDLTMKSSNSIWIEDSKLTKPKKYDSHWDASQIYYDSLRLFDFVRTKLNYPYAYGGNPLPVKIYVYSSDTNGAFYSPSHRGGGIFLGYKSSRHQNTECPENCAWHELFHFTMYNKYAKWSDYGTPGSNHEGFKNNNTGDSYEEGYAEFWPLILSKELEGSTDAIYGGYANLELNYNPWVSSGLDEEFAVASLFWDLVDSNQDKGDATAFSYKELWDVLMAKRRVSVKEVYDAIQAKWPSKSAEINEVFVAHGFFKDTNKGNGKYDLREPFWDLDPDGTGKLEPNGVRDANEDYVDIGTPNDGLLRPHQVFTEGQDRIGTSSNYERTSRSSPKPFTPDSFVKVNGAPDDSLYKVSYSFSDSSLNYESYGIVDNVTGYVYIQLPPDEYEMTATVTIDNYAGSDSISVTPDDYFNPDTAGQGFMKEGPISVGAKKTDYCNKNGICEDAEISPCADCSVTAPAIPTTGGTTAGTGTSGTGTGTAGTGTTTTQPTTTGGQQDILDQISNMLGIDKTMLLVIGGAVFLVIILLIVVAVKRRGKKPPQQAPQQPQQQGNVIVIQQ